jgi:hypothetical protein
VAWSRDVVFVGEMNRAEIRSYDRGGILLRVLRWVPPEVLVTPDEQRAFREGILTGLGRPERRPDFQRWLSQVQFPESKPAFEEIIATSEGTLWVKDPSPLGSETERWTVYGVDGVTAATLDLPAGLRVVYVNQDHVLAVWVDELDLEYVRSYRINRTTRNN